MINKRKLFIHNDKKLLHKIGKQWVVISAFLLMALGAAGTTTTTNVHATVQDNQSTNSVATSQVASQATSSSNNKGANTQTSQIMNASEIMHSNLVNNSDRSSENEMLNNSQNVPSNQVASSGDNHNKSLMFGTVRNLAESKIQSSPKISVNKSDVQMINMGSLNKSNVSDLLSDLQHPTAKTLVIDAQIPSAGIMIPNPKHSFKLPSSDMNITLNLTPQDPKYSSNTHPTFPTVEIYPNLIPTNINSITLPKGTIIPLVITGRKARNATEPLTNCYQDLLDYNPKSDTFGDSLFDVSDQNNGEIVISRDLHRVTYKDLYSDIDGGIPTPQYQQKNPGSSHKKGPITLPSDWNFVDQYGNISTQLIGTTRFPKLVMASNSNNGKSVLIAPNDDGLTYKYDQSNNSIEFVSGLAHSDLSDFLDNPYVKRANHITFDPGINLKYVKNMDGMFKGDTNLQSLDFGPSFKTSDISDKSDMFKGDTSLNSITIQSSDTTFKNSSDVPDLYESNNGQIISPTPNDFSKGNIGTFLSKTFAPKPSPNIRNGFIIYNYDGKQINSRQISSADDGYTVQIKNLPIPNRTTSDKNVSYVFVDPNKTISLHSNSDVTVDIEPISDAYSDVNNNISSYTSEMTSLSNAFNSNSQISHDPTIDAMWAIDSTMFSSASAAVSGYRSASDQVYNAMSQMSQAYMAYSNAMTLKGEEYNASNIGSLSSSSSTGIRNALTSANANSKAIANAVEAIKDNNSFINDNYKSIITNKKNISNNATSISTNRTNIQTTSANASASAVSAYSNASSYANSLSSAASNSIAHSINSINTSISDAYDKAISQANTDASNAITSAESFASSSASSAYSQASNLVSSLSKSASNSIANLSNAISSNNSWISTNYSTVNSMESNYSTVSSNARNANTWVSSNGNTVSNNASNAISYVSVNSGSITSTMIQTTSNSGWIASNSSRLTSAFNSTTDADNWIHANSTSVSTIESNYNAISANANNAFNYITANSSNITSASTQATTNKGWISTNSASVLSLSSEWSSINSKITADSSALNSAINTKADTSTVTNDHNTLSGNIVIASSIASEASQLAGDNQTWIHTNSSSISTIENNIDNVSSNAQNANNWVTSYGSTVSNNASNALNSTDTNAQSITILNNDKADKSSINTRFTKDEKSISDNTSNITKNAQNICYQH